MIVRGRPEVHVTERVTGEMLNDVGIGLKKTGSTDGRMEEDVVSAAGERPDEGRGPAGEDVNAMLLEQHGQLDEPFVAIKTAAGENTKHRFDQLHLLLARHEVADAMILGAVAGSLREERHRAHRAGREPTAPARAVRLRELPPGRDGSRSARHRGTAWTRAHPAAAGSAAGQYAPVPWAQPPAPAGRALKKATG
jgi:hypothetical protein